MRRRSRRTHTHPLVGFACSAALAIASFVVAPQTACAQDRVTHIAALDQIESALLPRGNSLAWLARLVDPQVDAAASAVLHASLAAEFAAAAKPIAGTDDAARSLARVQRLRGTALWAMASAADPMLPGAETFRSWMNELVNDPDAIDARHRGAFLLAVAIIRQREGGDAAAPLATILARTDFPAAERVAARAIEATLGSTRPAAMTEAMRTLLRSSAREPAAIQILLADIIARSLANPAEAWCTLVDSRSGEEALAIAPFLLPRLRSLPCDPTTAHPLHAIAAIRASSGERRAAIEARLQAIADARPSSPLLPLILTELAWAALDAKRYTDAIAQYERFARDCPTNADAGSMMGIAIFLRSTLLEAEPSERATTELAAALDDAIARFPNARELTEWLALASTLAAKRGDAEAMRRFGDAAPRHASMVPVLLRAAEATLDDEGMPANERAARAGRYLEQAREFDVDAARRRLLEARHASARGEIDEAAAALSALTLDEQAPDDVRRSALAALIATLSASKGEVRPSSDVVLEIAEQPTVWWPAVAPTLRAWILRVTEGEASDANRAEATRLLGVLGPLFLGPAARDGDGAWRCRLAEAMLRAGAPSEVDRIFPADESHTPDALLLRAESQRRRGGDGALASAMRLFREVTDASKERSPAWWRAELGQLRVAAAGAGNVDAVRARIHWLRSLDHDLGGPATGPAIEELLRSLPDR